VAILGDQIDAYLAALAEGTQRPSWQSLEELRAECEQPLVARYSWKTARKHVQIVALFIDFLCDYTDMVTIAEPTRVCWLDRRPLRHS